MADSLTALKAAMQQGWRPGGVSDIAGPVGAAGVDELGRPLGPHEPDTWGGGFWEGLKREFTPDPQMLQAMTEAATIRPRDTKLDTLAQFAPYLLPTAPGTTPATQLVKNLRGRTVPTHAQRLAAAEESYAAAKGPRSPAQVAANTVEVRPTPTTAPAAPGFNISPTLSEAELNARVAARRAATAARRPISLSDITPEVVPEAGEYTSAGFPEIEPPLSEAELNARLAATRAKKGRR